MPRKSKTDAAAIRAGQDHAKIILKMRAQKLKRRTAVLRSLPPVKAVQAGRFSAELGLVMAAAGQSAGTVVAEGDSWFRLPHSIMPPTLIDVLQERYGYPIDNMAHWGDTLADMILAGQFWPPVISGQADTFLFSGGGNDVLGGEGGIARFLNLFDVDHTKPSDAAYYIKPEFYQNLKLIVQNYESLIQRVHVRAPNVIMLGHGYDHVIPLVSGPWIGNGMMFVGLDPTFRRDLCQAIVRIMIDAFNSALAALATTYSNYRYVDLRGAIGKNEWRDELHPTAAGAAKTAARFDVALRKLPKSGAFTAPLIASRTLFRRAA